MRSLRVPEYKPESEDSTGVEKKLRSSGVFCGFWFFFGVGFFGVLRGGERELHGRRPTSEQPAPAPNR